MLISTHSGMPELNEVLARLGLTRYLQVLTENGFHSWETVVDITEEDLTALDFKLGHRRALQREIATSRGVPSSLSLDPENVSLEPTSLSTSALETLTRQISPPPPREKRRYRRHPKPDENAPKKPKTAYVNFADKLREDPDVSQLSFVNIAREVGRRWQDLPAMQKRGWESDAARAMQEFEAQMDEYKRTDNWRKYQRYLNDFKSQQSQQIQSSSGKRPNASRSTTDSSNNTRVYSRASPTSSSSSPTTAPSLASMGTEAEVCHNALTLAFSELVTLRGEILDPGTQIYNASNKPPRELMSRSIHAFIRGTGSLLFMWTEEQADELLDRIYQPSASHTTADAMSLAECFTVAAMGAHYDSDCFPDRIRKLLYASGTLHFHEQTARQDYLRTMRLLLCMSFYSLLEKHMSARYLIAAGLQVARWKYPSLHGSNSGPLDENWRKIYRSLIFMDSWLSYTLGYTSEVTPKDVQIICGSRYANAMSNVELIHAQTSKIGLVAAEIAKTLAAPELATRENIAVLSQKLDTWRKEVPHTLQIETLTSTAPTDLDVYQRRAILMVHIMYLGALILLYRQLLVATAETQLTDGAAWNSNITVQDARIYRDQCALAAQQTARILKLISFDGTLTKRCWLIIYWSFTSAIVLLFSATTKIMDGQTDGVEADIHFAGACIEGLESCRSFEPIAARYLDTIWPIYKSLHEKHQRMASRSKASLSAILHPLPPLLSPSIAISKEEMGPVCEKLSLLLIDPFGRKQGMPDDRSMRRMLNADGSCSVFWWK
ncbi:hypothetical protein CC86DRAFT_401107 [Ophiobolus disseminans]|uniref:HMG box domain-containing protein n=1 Tax=Ophiobolus disseminans TaxID=1469910 RepID=A0A6A7AI24_9PLEO|nr:hypothetical protein CC86DRAFT_401107 [Ophiobolus disseminans]